MNRSVKGLLIKEVKLMKSQMRFFVVILVVWGVLMAGSMDNSFLIGYTAMLCSFLTLSTFSYDEYENGAAYLLTLPVLRKDYVSEKYMFGFLVSTLPTILMSVLLWIVHAVQGRAGRPADYLLAIVISLPMAYLLLVLEIPLVIRFGREKSRIISLALIMTMGVGFGMIRYLNELAGIDSMEAVSSIAGLGTGVLAALTAAVLAVLMALSYKLSCRFMEKKEF